jgi:hypothetical protein
MNLFEQGFRGARAIVVVMTAVILAGSLIVNAEVYNASVKVGNTGSISLTEVTARSGASADIQAAVNIVQAAGGGIVYVPSGTYSWNGETVKCTGGVSIMGAGAGCDGHASNWNKLPDLTILHNNKAAPFTQMFSIDGSNGRFTRISGIRFEGNVTSANDNLNGEAIVFGAYTYRPGMFRVDHCTFIDFPGTAVVQLDYSGQTSRGLIDHCGDWAWAYGVMPQGQAGAWDDNIAHFLGQWDNSPAGFPILYVEDCHFSRCRHCIASNQGAWYVVRYNLMDNSRPMNFAPIDVHGTGGGTAPGGRGLEAYNNTIIGTPGYGSAQPFWIRGGGGAIFNNRMLNAWLGIELRNEGGTQLYEVRNMWIWGNTMDRGTLINNSGNYTEGVKYFLRAPNSSQDGFTYTPYPYPHPLTQSP